MRAIKWHFWVKKAWKLTIGDGQHFFIEGDRRQGCGGPQEYILQTPQSDGINQVSKGRMCKAVKDQFHLAYQYWSSVAFASDL